MTDTLTLPIKYLPQSDSSALVGERRPAPEMRTPRSTSKSSPFGLQQTLVGDAHREKAFLSSISQIQDYCKLSEDWDTYGGQPASPQAAGFAMDLLNQVRGIPEVSAPDVRPISTGVYVEWHSAQSTLYFEVDEDSVLFVMQQGDVTIECGEDPCFQVSQAIDHVRRFHQDDIATVD